MHQISINDLLGHLDGCDSLINIGNY